MVDEDIARKRLLMTKKRGTALQKIRALIDMQSIAESHDKILAQLHQPGNVGMHTRLLAVAIMKEAPLFAEVVQQGCEEGIFQTDSPLECAEFMLTATHFLTDRGVYPWTPEDLQRRARAFPALIEGLLKAPAGSFAFLVKRLEGEDDARLLR
jgi:hypothetical protein